MKNTIVIPGVMHVDAKGNVSHKDLKLTYNPTTTVFSTKWPDHLADKALQSPAPSQVVEAFEQASEEYQRRMMVKGGKRYLIVNVYGGNGNVALDWQPVILVGGDYYALDDNGVPEYKASLPKNFFVVDDTPDLRARLGLLRDSIKQAYDSLVSISSADDPAKALLSMPLVAADFQKAPASVNSAQPAIVTPGMNDEEL